MDEAIAQVVTFCDTTTERAAQYVQLADGDANQAVSLFFENNGADLAAQFTAPAAAAPASRLTGAGNAQDPINVDDGNISDDNDPEITGFRKHAPSEPQQSSTPGVEDDEVLARRLQEEMYGGAAEETVRAPIARQAETLVGPGAGSTSYAGAAIDPAIQERLQAMQSRRGSGFRSPGIFNQHQPTSNIWQGQGASDQAALSDATGGASDASARNGMLARLYQPPWELMYKGSWEDARDEGKEHKKWLLVNIQDASIFDCQVLNRDLWKNEGVADTVRENFVLLQYSKDDPRADQYIQYYFHDSEVPDAYPHVAVVDPRTGEQIKLWSRTIPKAADFLMQLHEFLDRYSLEAGARNPVAKRKAEGKKKTIDQMTEEEQLEQALQASLASQEGQGLKPPGEDPDDLTRSIGDMRAARTEEPDAMSIVEGKDEAVEPAGASPFAQIPALQHVEPAPGPTVTRVQIRHPAGRIVRRFDVGDPVQRIYEFLKAEPLEGREGKEFELVSMGKNLMESRQETIESAGLKNGTVMVEFIEE